MPFGEGARNVPMKRRGVKTRDVVRSDGGRGVVVLARDLSVATYTTRRPTALDGGAERLLVLGALLERRRAPDATDRRRADPARDEPRLLRAR